MRGWVKFIGLVLAVAACSSGSTSPTGVETTAITAPAATTTTEPPATTTTTSAAAPAATTTTTSLVVPAAECAVDLPDTLGSDVQDVAVAVYAGGGPNPAPRWTVPLGDRPVEMDTLGDRVYLASSDGFVASFDLDPCGLDWLASVGPGVTDIVAGEAGVFVVTDTSLTVLERIEGLPTSFPLSSGRHEMVAGNDVLAVSDGASVLLYDYLTQQSASLPMGSVVTGLAASESGLAVSRGVTVEFRTWLGLPVWERNMFEPVETIGADGSSVMVGLSGGNLVVLDDGSGEVRWEQPFDPETTLAIGPVDHEELHVLELASVARQHHFAIEDGSPVFASESPVWQTFAEYDDGVILVVDEGAVTARNLLEQDLWTITTGADGLSRFTEVDITDGFIVALSYSAERF